MTALSAASTSVGLCVTLKTVMSFADCTMSYSVLVRLMEVGWGDAFDGCGVGGRTRLMGDGGTPVYGT